MRDNLGGGPLLRDKSGGGPMHLHTLHIPKASTAWEFFLASSLGRGRFAPANQSDQMCFDFQPVVSKI